MNQYVLSTTSCTKELLEKIGELEAENESMSTFVITSEDNVCCITCQAEAAETDDAEILSHIASDIVQQVCILQVAKEYLAKRNDLLPQDVEEIEQRFIANNYLSKREGFSAISYYLVYMPILTDLKQYQRINIDGWLRFRADYYKLILEEILEQLIEDYHVKKEMIDFIKLLREIGGLNEETENILHLICDENGGMRVLNEKMEDVTTAYTFKYCKEMLLDPRLSKEDFILNILITIYPRKIVIHQKQKFKHPQFIETIEEIFSSNVAYCMGCEACSKAASKTRKINRIDI